MGYSASSALGRANAAVTNATQPLVTIVEHREGTRPRMRWVPAAPPFTTQPQYVADPDNPVTVFEAVADCGHVLHHSEHTPSAQLTYTYAVGKRKRCFQCPVREPKAAKPPKAPWVPPPVDPDVVYRPEPDEVVAVRVECGETVRIETTGGVRVFHGDEEQTIDDGDGEPFLYNPTRVYVVPFDGPRVGWNHSGWSETGLAVGNGKHRIDRPVWKDAEKLLRRSHRAVYVRIEQQPYYNKTRHTAVSVRPHEADQ